jgi:TetR/AcrR family transcriptional repressor of nem operon
LTGRLAELLAQMGDPDPAADAGSLIAEMVGALSLARADPDRGRSDANLERSRAALKARFGLPNGPLPETLS